jgi:hypothetical protein
VTDRRNLLSNRWGCKPTGDVCVGHDQPLVCRHGCDDVKVHKCKCYHCDGSGEECRQCGGSGKLQLGK